MYTVGIETVEREQILFKDMTDEHLANWIYHTERYLPERFDDEIRGLLRAEAERRELSAEFINKADGSFMRGDIRVRFDARYGKYVEVQQ